MTCSVEGCDEPVKYREMCKRCYNRITMAERRGGYKKIGDFCNKGHKIEGENAQFYMNHGVERVRCKTCVSSPSVKVKIGDVCKAGHTIEGANLMRKMRDGKEFFRCRECARIRNRSRRVRAIEDGSIHEMRAREYESRRRLEQERNPEKYRKELEKSDELLTQEIRKGVATFNSLKYLKLSKRAAQASQALEEAFEKDRAKCYSNPGPYIDYEEGQEPRAIDAYLLCEGCPLLVQCGRFAAAYHPPIGVWAGEVYVDGKVRR